MNIYTINGYKRITKAAARKAYNNGTPIYICPVNLRPGPPWLPEIKAEWETSGSRFETITAAAAVYNCNADAGRYLAYYIKQ